MFNASRTVVLFIAVAAIGVVGGMGSTVSNQIGAMSQELAGTNGTAEQAAATAAAAAGAADGTAQKNLSNYTATGGNVGQ